MRKLLLSFVMMLAGLTAMAQSTVVYTLTPEKGTNNAYAGNCDVTINGIVWNVEGNSQMLPWRFGGKSLTEADRTLTSKTPMYANVDKVVLTIGKITATLNSTKLLVADNETFDNAVEVAAEGVTANSDVVFDVTANVGAYFKFVFNVNTGNSNQFVEVAEVLFYGTLPEGNVDAPVFSLDGGSYVGAQTVEILAGDGCKIFYTLDGTEPTEESTEYTAPITLTETTTVKAIAVLDGKASVVATQTYTILKVMTLDEVLEAATKTDTSIAMDMEGLVCTGTKGTSNAYFTDGNGKGILVYQSAHGFKVGDKLSGVVVVTLTTYNGAAELKSLKASANGLTVTPGQEIPVVERFVSELSAASQGSVVLLKGVVYKEGKFYHGEDAATPYNAFMTLPELEEGATYNITGVVTYFNYVQICPRSEEDIVKEIADGIDGVVAGKVLTDGKYVANGRLVVVKAGKKYDASGLQQK